MDLSFSSLFEIVFQDAQSLELLEGLLMELVVGFDMFSVCLGGLASFFRASTTTLFVLK